MMKKVTEVGRRIRLEKAEEKAELGGATAAWAVDVFVCTATDDQKMAWTTAPPSQRHVVFFTQ